MTPDLTSDTLSWERSMTAMGEDHYDQQANKYRERGLFSMVPSGRALLRDSVPRVERELRAWQKANKSFTAVSRGYAWSWLERLKPEVAALVACTAIIDNLHRHLTARTVAYKIGQGLEDEDRFSRVKREHPDFWREVKLNTKHSKKHHRRMTALAKAEKLGWIPAQWPATAKNRAGLVMLQCFDRGTGLLRFDLQWYAKHRSKLIVAPTDECLEWMEGADDRAALLMPLYMPTLEPPVDWGGPTGGGYLSDLVLRRPISRTTSDEAKRAFAQVDPATYGEPLRALNNLQATPWRVNEDLLEVLSHLQSTGGRPLPDLAKEDVPPRPPKWATDAYGVIDTEVVTEEYKDWRQTVGAIKDRNRARVSQRVVVERSVRVGQMLREQDRPFYYPHRACFRGRFYPIPYWVQPQGPDMGRALLRFAGGGHHRLSEEGMLWALVHGANLWGVKGSIQNRAGWAMDFLDEQAAQVYSDPLEYTVWHEADGGKAPFQFLAWVLEMAAYRLHGQPISLPIHVDAKNNGLQLFALLTGDRDLARLTGAIGPGELDLYEEVGSRAWRQVQADAEANSSRPVTREQAAGPLARKWAEILEPHGGIPRSIAKRPTMVFTYGVTEWSSQNYVRDSYDELFGRLAGPLGPRPGPACKYLSQVMQEKVSSVCKGAVAAMEWLQGLAAACHEQGTYLHWTAPNGWPVHQDYRKTVQTRIQTTLGDSMRNLHFKYGTGPRNKKASLQGAPPNVIHSVDASVQSYAVSRWDGPITAVHDDFGTLPNGVPRLLTLLKQGVVASALDADPLSSIHREVESYLRVEVEPPPRFGTIEPQEVMEAEGLFS